MLRICYMSRARAHAAVNDFADIVRVAVDRNAADAITGLLLFDGHRYLQALEGDHAATSACFGRIRADERHSDIVTIERATITERQFGGWSMQARHLADGRADYAALVAADVAAVTEPRLTAFFLGFAALAR